MSDVAPNAGRKNVSTCSFSSTAKDWRSDWIVFIVSALLAAGMLWKAGSTASIAVRFEKELLSLIPGVFGSMLLVSLIVERAIEVFVSIWCDRQSAIHEQNLGYWKARQKRLLLEVQALIAERDGNMAPDSSRKRKIEQLILEKYAAIEESNDNADAEEKTLLPFQARTRKVSTWVGLVIGICTSAVGFRFLSQMVVLDDALKATGQYQWFIAADVLLTGAVLAGGSKLVHQIFCVYDSFMVSAQKSLSDKSHAG